MTSVNVIVTIKVFMRIITYRSCLDMSSYLANNFEKLLGSLCKPNSLAKVWQNLRNPKVSLDQLTSLRIHNHNNIISYLNDNSIRSKFDDLKLITDENVDILCIAETKIDCFFPNLFCLVIIIPIG